MVLLRVIKPEGFAYGLAPDRKRYIPGDTFHARERDADLLVRARMAEVIVNNAQDYQTREIKAEEAPEKKTRGRPRKVVSGEADTKEPVKRRMYRRRDMKAEE